MIASLALAGGAIDPGYLFKPGVGGGSSTSSELTSKAYAAPELSLGPKQLGKALTVRGAKSSPSEERMLQRYNC